MTAPGPREQYVEMNVWAELLKTNLCPFCGSNLTNIRDPTQLNRLRIGCINCNQFYLPQKTPPTREKVKRKATQREKEKRAEMSGGSLYPPLQLHYFCGECYQMDLAILEERNELEKKLGTQLSKPTGNEGMAAIQVRNRSLVVEGYNIFPFSCRCGQRYQVTVTMDRTDPKEFQLFGIELGFHTQCVGCSHCFDKRVGVEEMQFRCDFNLQCPHIRKHLDRIRMVHEEDE